MEVIVANNAVSVDGYILTVAELISLIQIAKDFAELAEWEYPTMCPAMQSKIFTIIGKSRR